MDFALLTLAFGAGVAIFFSPCGIALLPSYVSFLLSKKEEQAATKSAKVREGLKIGLIVSLGIITVFFVLGIVVGLVGNFLAPYAFWFGTIIGALLIILGVFMLFGKSLHIPRLQIKTDAVPSLKTYYIFGIGYALGGISCTLGVFLFVVGTALSAGSFGQALVTFISFTAGSVLLMIIVTTVAATAKSFVSAWIARYVRYVNLVSAIIIMVGGAYLIWFNARAFL